MQKLYGINIGGVFAGIVSDKNGAMFTVRKMSMPSSVLTPWSAAQGLLGVESGLETLPLAEMYKKLVHVYAGVFAVANSAASVPIKVMRDGKGNPEHVPNHPLQYLLNTLTSDRYSLGSTSSFDLMEETYSFAELVGNAYWLLNGGKAPIGGPPDEIVSLKPFKVKPVADKTSRVKYYEYHNNYEIQRIAAEEILHFKYFSPTSDLLGQGSIEAAKDAALIDMYATSFTKGFFKRGATLSGVLETDEELDREVMEPIVNAFREGYTGSENAFKVKGLSHGLKFKPLQANTKDILIPDLRHMNREEILEAIGVPPVMVTLLDGATYANAEIQEKMFWKVTILPKLTKVLGKLNILARRYTGTEGNVYVIYDTSQIEALQADLEKLSRVCKEMFLAGSINRNEWRHTISNGALPQLGAIDGGAKFYLPFNLVEAGESKEESKSIELEYTLDETVDRILRDATSAFNTKKEQEVKALLWKRFATNHSKFTKLYASIAKKHFSKQQAELLDGIDLIDKSYTKAQRADNEYINKSISDLIALLDNLTGAGQAAFRAVIKEALLASGQEALILVGSELEFNIIALGVIDFITIQGAELVTRVDDTTKQALRETLAEGLINGENRTALSDRIMEVMDIRRSRADVIGRTESQSALNFGSLEGWTQSGVVNKKEWLDSQDELVRDGHEASAIEPVEINQPFIVNGESLMYPGDPSGSAENRIQCRCTMLPMIEEMQIAAMLTIAREKGFLNV